MPLLTVFGLLATVVVLFGALLALVASVRAVLHFQPAPFGSSRPEVYALAAAVLAAVLGCLWLFLGPAYAGSSGNGSISPSGTVAHSTSEATLSFYAVNGPKVIPLFVLPVLVALAPFGARRWRTRPIIYGLCALLLGGQAAIGISGYGLLFAPSGALMLLAGILASWRLGRMPHNPSFEQTDASTRSVLASAAQLQR